MLKTVIKNWNIIIGKNIFIAKAKYEERIMKMADLKKTIFLKTAIIEKE